MINFYSWYINRNRTAVVSPNIWLSPYDGNWKIKYQAHNITTNSYFIRHATSKKGVGRCHKSVTGNNQGRRRTTPRDNRGFNRNGYHSKSIGMSLPVISVSLPLNHSVINPPQLSSVCQQSSRSSHNCPHVKKCLYRNHINSKSNELSSPVIPKLPPWNYPWINPTQLSSVCQQSSRSSPNTMH